MLGPVKSCRMLGRVKAACGIHQWRLACGVAAMGVAAFFQVFHVDPVWRFASIGALSAISVLAAAVFFVVYNDTQGLYDSTLMRPDRSLTIKFSRLVDMLN